MKDGVSDNVMDQWILSFTQTLLLFVQKEMSAYRLYTVVPRLIRFVDHLTNWYVRMNRKRLKVFIYSSMNVFLLLLTIFHFR